MITYDLNAEDVANLIKAHLCDDLDITAVNEYALIRSDSEKFYGMVRVFAIGQVSITGEEHKKLTMGASSYDYTSVYIAVTPEGVFQFNLSELRLEFENYVDHYAAIDTDIADLDISNGTQILEWYPEFSSEDEYIDALMSAGTDIDTLEDVPMWEEGDEW
jgi:hypothetical protein